MANVKNAEGKKRSSIEGRNFILILGGARSGKSRFAQQIAENQGGKVLFVATGQALDDEMVLRIKEHKRKRPQNWRTLEIAIRVGQELEQQLADADIVLLDCLTLLVSNIILDTMKVLKVGSAEGTDFAEAERRVTSELEGLNICINKHNGIFIIVSNEVGLGLVPDNRLGRVYRDSLGRANQFLAQYADEVYFMTSGIPVKIKG